jgi:integrase
MKKTAKSSMMSLRQLVCCRKSSETILRKVVPLITAYNATILLASGEPVIDVSRRLGHSKPSITLDLYGHEIPGQDQKIAAKINELYRI